MTVKLNIGSGNTVIEGFTAIDRKHGREAFPLDYPDDSVDEIRASHILEHFSFADVPKVLDDWVRVLKPGGKMRIAVPDLEWIGKNASDPKALFYVMGGQSEDNDFHKSAFTEPTLRMHLERAGMCDIEPWQSDNTDTASSPCSLNLQGIKGNPTEITIKIAAVVSIPRLGFNDHWGCIIEALQPFKIPIRRFTGAYWGQCMQRVISDCVDDGLDWVLTLDYDTMFTDHNVDTMLGEFGRNPDIDALAALQVRRGKGFPLMTMKGQTETEVTALPMEVDTAHFGLTLLRCDALRNTPKPWFKGMPDADGDYGPERVDSDIWFWKQWREAGHSVYVSPNAKVGHLELMVAEFGEGMEPQHVYVNDWWKRNGKTLESLS